MAAGLTQTAKEEAVGLLKHSLELAQALPEHANG